MGRLGVVRTVNITPNNIKASWGRSCLDLGAGTWGTLPQLRGLYSLACHFRISSLGDGETSALSLWDLRGVLSRVARPSICKWGQISVLPLRLPWGLQEPFRRKRLAHCLPHIKWWLSLFLCHYYCYYDIIVLNLQYWEAGVMTAAISIFRRSMLRKKT